MQTGDQENVNRSDYVFIGAVESVKQSIDPVPAYDITLLDKNTNARYRIVVTKEGFERRPEGGFSIGDYINMASIAKREVSVSRAGRIIIYDHAPFVSRDNGENWEKIGPAGVDVEGVLSFQSGGSVVTLTDKDQSFSFFTCQLVMRNPRIKEAMLATLRSNDKRLRISLPVRNKFLVKPALKEHGVQTDIADQAQKADAAVQVGDATALGPNSEKKVQFDGRAFYFDPVVRCIGIETGGREIFRGGAKDDPNFVGLGSRAVYHGNPVTFKDVGGEKVEIDRDDTVLKFQNDMPVNIGNDTYDGRIVASEESPGISRILHQEFGTGKLRYYDVADGGAIIEKLRDEFPVTIFPGTQIREDTPRVEFAAIPKEVEVAGTVGRVIMPYYTDPRRMRPQGVPSKSPRSAEAPGR